MLEHTFANIHFITTIRSGNKIAIVLKSYNSGQGEKITVWLDDFASDQVRDHLDLWLNEQKREEN